MTSISSILADTLDLIGKEDVNPSDDKHTAQNIPSSISTRTASSILLEQKKKSRALLEELDFIPVANAERPTNIMFDQIASSSVEAPTYWKDAAKEKTKAKPAVIAMPSGNKKRQEKLKKGEDYADRFNEKKASKIHRKNRLDALKRPY